MEVSNGTELLSFMLSPTPLDKTSLALAQDLFFRKAFEKCSI